MITLDSIRKPVTAELAAFDEFVERQFTAEGELLSDMLRYALSSRGKGIRPLLVMLSAAMNASAGSFSTNKAFRLYGKTVVDSSYTFTVNGVTHQIKGLRLI